jgi:hypothetical protein
MRPGFLATPLHNSLAWRGFYMPEQRKERTSAP